MRAKKICAAQKKQNPSRASRHENRGIPAMSGVEYYGPKSEVGADCMCQLGTLKLGSTRGAIARPYACDFGSLRPKGTTQGPGLWTLPEYPSRICGSWSSEVRTPCMAHGILKKKWNRAVCERHSTEPSRTCLPTLVGPQWAVTAVPLSHSLNIFFVRKIPFLPFWPIFWRVRDIF